MISSEAKTALLGPTDDSALDGASLSSALVTIFRGNFCDVILPGRISVTFKRDKVLYDVGAKARHIRDRSLCGLLFGRGQSASSTNTT